MFIGGDPAGGGRDLDGSTGPIDLSSQLSTSGAAANRNQGYHIFLTVHADGSIGSDVKHKVFWVQCAAPARAGSSGAAGGPQASRSAVVHAGAAQAAKPAKPVNGSPAFTG